MECFRTRWRAAADLNHIFLAFISACRQHWTCFVEIATKALLHARFLLFVEIIALPMTGGSLSQGEVGRSVVTLVISITRMQAEGIGPRAREALEIGFAI